MYLIHHVTQDDVWEHWKRVENHNSTNFRSDIRDPLPTDLTWSFCEFQPYDIDHLYIISSDDWTDISGGTFRVSDVAPRIASPSNCNDSIRIASDIRNKISHLESGNQLDSRLILVTDSPSLTGPFTLIEGNKRCVAFYLRETLIGCSVFVGSSPNIKSYFWARHTYEQINSHNPLLHRTSNNRRL